MKKVLLFTVIVAGLGFTSCSKAGDCECTVDGTTETTTLDEVNQAGLDLSQDDFEALCDLGDGCKVV
ncbi:MAG: hypothetical protein QNK84_08030 [Flavobacteriales bacterium]